MKLKYTRTQATPELKDKLEKLERDVKSLVANQKNWKEEMKKSNVTLKKQIKDKFVLVLERILDDKLDIMNKKQKDLDDKMSGMTQDINTITQKFSTMTQNHITLMEVLQKLMPGTNHVSSPYMWDASSHVSTQETLNKNKEDLEK